MGYVIIIVAFFLFCCIFIGANSEKNEAFEELRYEGSKEGDFWRYLRKRKQGKLTYTVPEFEERIIKMNELKEKDTN